MTIEDLTMLILFILIAPFLSFYLIKIIEDDLLKGKNILYQAAFKSVMIMNSIFTFPFITLIYVYRNKKGWLKGVKGYYKQLTRIA